MKTTKPGDAFTHASGYWDAGDLPRAFRLFKSLAVDGNTGAQLNLGYFFDHGIGVRRNEAKALYWYRRSYVGGEASGANNIGTIYRDRGDHKQALVWFDRAIKAGSAEPRSKLPRFY
jgi:TPR repeat protein